MSYIVAQATTITNEANKSLDSYERKTREFSVHEEIFELGMLLACIRNCHSAAETLSRMIPSPNRVPREYAQSYAEIAKALFHFIESCEHREEMIGKKALGFSCETAV